MNEINIILGMDWIHKCYATIDYRNWAVRFQFLNELELEQEGSSSIPTGQIVSNLKANKMLSKEYLYNLVIVNDLEHEVPSINFVSIVKNFQDIFPKELPGILPEREIDFGVDFDPNTKPIYIPPYRMTLAELKKFKLQLKYLLHKGFI